MSHYDENHGAPGVLSPGADDARLPEATGSTAAWRSTRAEP